MKRDEIDTERNNNVDELSGITQQKKEKKRKKKLQTLKSIKENRDCDYNNENIFEVKVWLYCYFDQRLK